MWNENIFNPKYLPKSQMNTRLQQMNQQMNQPTAMFQILREIHYYDCAVSDVEHMMSSCQRVNENIGQEPTADEALTELSRSEKAR